MSQSVETENWEFLAFRGMLAILFGIIAVFWPDVTLTIFVYLFGGFILASGLMTLIGGFGNVYETGRSFQTKLLMVVVGIVEIGVGVYLLRHPLVTFTTLILIVGLSLIFRGVVEAVNGLIETGSSMHKFVMAVGGILTVLVGIFMLFQPEKSGIAFIWIIGLNSLIVGSLYVALAMNMKKLAATNPLAD